MRAGCGRFEDMLPGFPDAVRDVALAVVVVAPASDRSIFEEGEELLVTACPADFHGELPCSLPRPAKPVRELVQTPAFE